MSLRPARIIFPVALLAAAVCATDAQQPSKAQTSEAQSSGKAVPKQPAASGGVVVFIDPATGKIRQPDAAEIGALTRTATPANASTAAAPTMIYGPGGAVGITLGDDSLSYMVVTKTADGKLATDCVTGEKAATDLVSKGVTPKSKEAADDK